jgi:hypothetical protein
MAYVARMTRTSRRGLSAAPVLLYGLFGLFVAATAYLIASSLTRRSVPTYAPTAMPSLTAPDRREHNSLSTDTLTIDATDADRWTYVSLTRGAVLAPFDSAGWELAVRRYQIRSSGRVADIGTAPFDDVRASGTERMRGAPPNATGPSDFGHWYRYSWLTHLLEPRGHVYLMQMSGDRAYALQIISYYCPGPTAGCLTLRYAPAR